MQTILEIEEVLLGAVKIGNLRSGELRALDKVYSETFGWPEKVEKLRAAMRRAGLDVAGKDYDTLEHECAEILNYAELIGLLEPVKRSWDE